jgi:hypothetical protein
LDEQGNKISKNKLKKKNKKNTLKKMFITGKAVFFDFRILLEGHLDFFGKSVITTSNNRKP